MLSVSHVVRMPSIEFDLSVASTVLSSIWIAAV